MRAPDSQWIFILVNDVWKRMLLFSSVFLMVLYSLHFLIISAGSHGQNKLFWRLFVVCSSSKLLSGSYLWLSTPEISVIGLEGASGRGQVRSGSTG